MNELPKAETLSKPYANEHSCRLEDPGKYERFARKNCHARHNGKCIDFVFGIKAGKSELQAMRYGKDIWSAEDARTHCRSKGGTFEAAKVAKADVPKNLFKVFVPFAKVDKEKRMVYGYCTTETLDSQGEIVEAKAVQKAWPDYMKWANIREMHQLSAVGVAKEFLHDERGTWIGAKVVDDRAWKFVLEGVYKGFSLGGRALRKLANRIKEIIINEISIVDRPSNPDTEFALAKRDESGNFVEVAKAEWDTKFINDLPDAAFAIVLPGGKKDDDGKTVPRSLRVLPHHNKNVKDGKDNGSVDKDHLRNALARLPQVKGLSGEQRKRAYSHLAAHARELLPSWQEEKEKKKVIGKRWNMSLSKEFDVEAVPSIPATFEYEMFTEFLECQVKDLCQNDFFIPSPMIGSYLAAFKAVLSDFELADARNFAFKAEVPLVYEDIRLNSRKLENFLIEGTEFYRAGEGRGLVAKYSPNWFGLNVSLITSNGDREWNKGLLRRVHEWTKENNFLKGEKFALSGEFLEATGDSWEGLVLSDETKGIITKAAGVLSKKGDELASRGMMFVGRPGTGKTKTGRVLMNSVDCTFVWVSSRDFRKVDPIRALSLSFEIARDAAPSILFIEDIDTWLREYTIDLLKTELDGLKQNKGVLTILTSNTPEKLPDTLLDRPGRFHDIIDFVLPEEGERKKMIGLWAGQIDGGLLKRILKETEGFSGAHMRELVDFAKLIADEDGIDIGNALLRSLEKMARQRKLIEQIRGSAPIEHIKVAKIISEETEKIMSKLKKARKAKTPKKTEEVAPEKEEVKLEPEAENKPKETPKVGLKTGDAEPTVQSEEFGTIPPGEATVPHEVHKADEDESGEEKEIEDTEETEETEESGGTASEEESKETEIEKEDDDEEPEDEGEDTLPEDENDDEDDGRENDDDLTKTVKGEFKKLGKGIAESISKVEGIEREVSSLKERVEKIEGQPAAARPKIAVTVKKGEEEEGEKGTISKLKEELKEIEKRIDEASTRAKALVENRNPVKEAEVKAELEGLTKEYDLKRRELSDAVYRG